MDSGSSQPPWLLLLFLLLGAAYFAIAETSLSSVSKNKVKADAEKGRGGAKRALFCLDNFDKAITTLLICTNIVHIAAASVVTVWVTRRYGLSYVTLSTILTTIAVFFLGEMLPKTIGKKYCEKMCLFSAPVLCFFMKVFTPVSAVLAAIGNFAAKHGKSDPEVSVTEDELQDIIEDMAEEGTLDDSQSDLISSALSFGDVTVESILTPRVDIVAIDIDDDPEEILAFVKNQTHSRIPVYEKTIDNIVGVLQIRKYLKAYLALGKAPSVRELIDPVHYAHQSIQIDELLEDMSKNRLNMAVVTDSYGGTLGIVTVEDILEELVGDIWDEDDVVEEPVVKVGTNRYLCRADERLVDVFDAVGFEYEDDGEKDITNILLGDWVYDNFQAIPEKGQSFDYAQLRVSVEEIEHNRILSVQIEVLEKEDGEKEEEKE